MQKPILGLIEEVKINGVQLKAKIDTGADRNSICTTMIKKLKLAPAQRTIKVKSSHGITRRQVYKGELEIKGQKFTTDFTITDRNHLAYSALIGINSLKDRFLIDPSK